MQEKVNPGVRNAHKKVFGLGGGAAECRMKSRGTYIKKVPGLRRCTGTHIKEVPGKIQDFGKVEHFFLDSLL